MSYYVNLSRLISPLYLLSSPLLILYESLNNYLYPFCLKKTFEKKLVVYTNTIQVPHMAHTLALYT